MYHQQITEHVEDPLAGFSGLSISEHGGGSYDYSNIGLPLGSGPYTTDLARSYPDMGHMTAHDASVGIPKAEEWELYARRLDSGHWGCGWFLDPENEPGRICGYVADRALVKRHIESKHLQLRYEDLSDRVFPAHVHVFLYM